MYFCAKKSLACCGGFFLLEISLDDRLINESQKFRKKIPLTMKFFVSITNIGKIFSL